MPHTGTSMVYRTIIPNINYLSKNIYDKTLSKEARRRLEIITFYFTKANKNASLTCRHFCITRSYFYKWMKRFNPKYLGSLENKSHRPKHLRKAKYDMDTVALIRTYRENKDTCYMSAKKIAAILKQDYPDSKYCISAATIGRIIKNFNLFFGQTRTTTKRRVLGTKRWNKLKRRYVVGIKQDKLTPRRLIKFDMKHLYIGKKKLYAFCSIDIATREINIHLATNCSSRQARIAMEETVRIYGKNIIILNDNGSENQGETWRYLAEQEIPQYFAHPYSPKEKPFVERVIGSMQRECIDVYRADILNIPDAVHYIERWVNNYHFMRPHQALNYMTPAEYCATMGITIERRRVSMM